MKELRIKMSIQLSSKNQKPFKLYISPKKAADGQTESLFAPILTRSIFILIFDNHQHQQQQQRQRKRQHEQYQNQPHPQKESQYHISDSAQPEQCFTPSPEGLFLSLSQRRSLLSEMSAIRSYF